MNRSWIWHKELCPHDLNMSFLQTKRIIVSIQLQYPFSLYLQHRTHHTVEQRILSFPNFVNFVRIAVTVWGPMALWTADIRHDSELFGTATKSSLFEISADFN